MTWLDWLELAVIAGASGSLGWTCASVVRLLRQIRDRLDDVVLGLDCVQAGLIDVEDAVQVEKDAELLSLQRKVLRDVLRHGGD